MRPLIAIPARFSRTASAVRQEAEVTGRRLVEAVWAAGGEPYVMHPSAEDLPSRLERCDGVLLPGGGDLAPFRYLAMEQHETVYDVDDEQDAADLAIATEALRQGLPLLAICRGLQVVNVVLGGTLQQDMDAHHRCVVQEVPVLGGSLLARIAGTASVTVSCFHHQRLENLGAGLRVTAQAGDGTVEAAETPERRGWFLGVQWHPEETALHDPVQHSIFTALVEAARDWAQGGPRCGRPHQAAPARVRAGAA